MFRTTKPLSPIRFSFNRTVGRNRFMRGVLGYCLSVFLTGLLASQALAQSTRAPKTPPPAPFSTANEKCIVPASMHHGVNFHVLRAILKVESGLNPNAVGHNSNGTIDVGMGQHNSMHFRELAKFGIAPGHLKDACIATYVAAWHLKRNIVNSGNTWRGIANYHSATPYFNQRYQILLKNELIRSGALTGSIQPVPSISRSGSAHPSSPSVSGRSVASSPSMIVSDLQ